MLHTLWGQGALNGTFLPEVVFVHLLQKSSGAVSEPGEICRKSIIEHLFLFEDAIINYS